MEENKMRGKSIKLYIMGEERKNLKTAELGNWTGKAYIGLRKHIRVIQSIDELSTPGIYILISSLEDTYQKKIYIGEADEVNKRLSEQFKKKDWWDEFIVFISKDSNLTKAHVRYLEKELYLIAKGNPTTIQLDNDKQPTGSKLPEPEVDDMKEFNENIVFVLKNLGIIDFTKTYAKEDNNNALTTEIFQINLPKVKGQLNDSKLTAQMIITENGYRLLENSYVRKIESDSFKSHNYVALRSQLESEGYFKEAEYECYLKVNKNIDFTSPSAAAAIVRNISTNGRKEWKLANGMTLDEYENKQETLVNIY